MEQSKNLLYFPNHRKELTRKIINYITVLKLANILSLVKQDNAKFPGRNKGELANLEVLTL